MIDDTYLAMTGILLKYSWNALTAFFCGHHAIDMGVDHIIWIRNPKIYLGMQKQKFLGRLVKVTERLKLQEMTV